MKDSQPFRVEDRFFSDQEFMDDYLENTGIMVDYYDSLEGLIEGINNTGILEHSLREKIEDESELFLELESIFKYPVMGVRYSIVLDQGGAHCFPLESDNMAFGWYKRALKQSDSQPHIWVIYSFWYFKEFYT